MGDKLQLVPIDGETFAASMRILVEDYVDSLVRDRHLDPAYARTSTEKIISKTFPRGVDTPGMLFFAGQVAGESVGWIWTALPEPPERPDTAHVYSLYVNEAHRRRGYGRALMRAIERELTDRGVSRVALQVFGHNRQAMALYESLGYEPESVIMSKPLKPSPPVSFHHEALAAFRRGDTRRVDQLAQAELTRARGARDVASEVDAICMLARVALRRGDAGTARRLSSEALEVARASGDLRLQQIPVHLLAGLERVAGDGVAARSAYARSIALNESLGDAGRVASEQYNLGFVELGLGEVGRAADLFAASRRFTAASDDQAPVPVVLHVFAGAALAEAEGDPRRAVRWLAAVESWLSEAGEVLDPDDEAEQAALGARLRERLGADFDTEYAAGAGEDLRRLLTR